MNRPTGWYGIETVIDKKSSEILLILDEAGRSITYKYAAELIDNLRRKKDA